MFCCIALEEERIQPVDRAQNGSSATFRRVAARWIISEPPDQAAVTALAAKLQLSESVANLLLIRGHSDDESAKRFLRPRLDQLHDALLMKGADKAVDRALAAAEKAASEKQQPAPA